MKRPKPYRNQLLIHRLIASQQRMTRQNIVGIGCTLLGAVAALEAGTADSSDASSIAYSANLALLLCEQGLGAEYAGEIVAGQEAAAILIGQAHEMRHMDKPVDLDMLRRLAEIHIAQLESESCTWALIERAKDEMKRRTESGDVVRVEATQ
jgi:hypothetical protein